MEIKITINGDERLIKALENFSAMLNRGPTTAAGAQTQAAPVPQPTFQQPTAPQGNYQAPQQAYQQPQGPIVPPLHPTQAPTTGAVPTQAQGFTLDQLSKAAASLMDAGKLAELQQLIASFGVPALTMLPPEKYGEYATGLRQLGARI